jgi:4-phospho-D-threonate 3-dehydrogenase / 4-phospho-D-erythronate 3-dehydrogenase
MLPLIGITMGDPAGIGPEVTLKAAAQAHATCRVVVLGDLHTLTATALRLGSLLVPTAWALTDPYPTDPRCLPVVALSTLAPEHGTPGQPTPTGGEASYRYVETGVQLAMNKTLQGIVTAPISKAMWHAAGRDYPGHTELLAALTHTPEVRMMLVGRQLRVILVTTHIALARVPTALSTERIEKTILMTAAHLTRFHGLTRPRLAVAGLNPHAGEAGAFGDEEARIIAPAIHHLQAQPHAFMVDGPFPADTVFVRAVQGAFDGVICLYHDQGLIPLKLLSWEDGVNVTIGLPIVRTSPDHGTAFDIAGQGKADPRSMQAAIALAAGMTQHRSI